jgi:hypothetical protein
MKYRQGVKMKLLDSNKVRNAFSNVEKNFDSSLSFVSTEKSPTFSECHSRLQSVVMELSDIWRTPTAHPNKARAWRYWSTTSEGKSGARQESSRARAC